MQSKISILKSITLSKIENRPYKLNFAVTSACNSHCQTCRVWEVFQKNPQVIKDNLTLEEINLIFKHLPSRFTWLSLSGGEPFLRNDLPEICKAAVENISSLGLISIPSNGLLEKKIIKDVQKILSLPLKNLFLNFSLDGPPEIHDQIRGLRGAYQKTWSTYEKILALSKKEPRLNVNLETTVSRLNLNYLEDFFQKLVANHHEITVTIAHSGYLYKNTNNQNDFTNLNHDDKKLGNVIEIIKSGLSPTGPLDLIQKAYLNKIVSFYRNPKKQPIPCIATSNSFALDQNGNITPCFMWGKILGNIRDFNYDFQYFLRKNAGEITAVRNLLKRKKCPNCWTPCEAYQSIINRLPFSLL